MLAAYDRVRLRIEVLPGDGVQPERTLRFFYRDPVKFYPCLPGLFNISGSAVVRAARIHHFYSSCSLRKYTRVAIYTGDSCHTEVVT